jgi:hypothetical protein
MQTSLQRSNLYSVHVIDFGMRRNLQQDIGGPLWDMEELSGIYCLEENFKLLQYIYPKSMGECSKLRVKRENGWLLVTLRHGQKRGQCNAQRWDDCWMMNFVAILSASYVGIWVAVFSIIRIIKSSRLRLEGNVARMGEKRNVYRILL